MNSPRKHKADTPSTPVKSPVKSSRILRTTPIKSPKKLCLSPVKSPRLLRTPNKLLSTPTSTTTPSSEYGLRTPKSEIDIVRRKLHVSAVPDSPSTSANTCPILCREKEFNTIRNFIKEKIVSKSSGYMFISGKPGSGKTLAIHKVIENMKSNVRRKANNFKFIEVNGLYFSEPTKIFPKILEQIDERIAPPKQASCLLDEYFHSRSSKDVPIIFFIDELDSVYKRSSKVVKNILNWLKQSNSQLILLTVANDDALVSVLKNEILNGKEIVSLLFPSYSNEDLLKIVENRLEGTVGLPPGAIQFIIKTYNPNGDARGILDMCREILDMIIESDEDECLITLERVQKVCKIIEVDPIILHLKHASISQQFLLQSLADIGDDNYLQGRIYSYFQCLCTLQGYPCTSIYNLCHVAEILAVTGFIKAESHPINMWTPLKLSVDQKFIRIAYKCLESKTSGKL